MKEWSDEEMDKLFRKSAEELDPPYEPADWNNLRSRLDEADGITPAGGWLKKAWPWLVVGLLLLIGGLGVYHGTQSNEGKGTPPVASTRPTDRPSTQVPDAGQAEVSTFLERKGTSESKEENEIENASPAESNTVPHEPGKSPINTERKNTQDLKELPRSLASVSGVRDQPNRSEQERGEGAILLPKQNPKLVQSPSRGRQTSEVDLAKATGQSEVGRPVTLNETAQLGLEKDMSAQAGETRETQSVDEPHENWLRVEPLDSRKNYRESEGPAYPEVAYTNPSDNLSGESPADAPVIQIPKWSVRIGVSPDLSVVRMSDMMRSMKPGPSASLLVERSVGEKWSLQTGVIRSLKKYSAPFSDYHPDKHLYQKTMPVSVDGTCTVFEVPLNVRFDFSQKPKTRWFAGAGVSSYKMQKENYTYNYATYVYNAAKGWGGSTGWYFLSHANASVGYERRLAERLSLVAEPYVRIPLRGVGFGKVNLFTGGIWFSLRYTPVFRK